MSDKTTQKPFSDELVEFSKLVDKTFNNVSEDVKKLKAYFDESTKEIDLLKKLISTEITNLKKDVTNAKNNINQVNIRLNETNGVVKKDKTKIIRDVNEITSKIIKIESNLKIK